MLFRIDELKENFYSWLSYRLPKNLVYYATIRLGVNGTTGKYNATNVANVRFVTILNRWEKNNGA